MGRGGRRGRRGRRGSGIKKGGTLRVAGELLFLPQEEAEAHLHEALGEGDDGDDGDDGDEEGDEGGYKGGGGWQGG